MSKFSTCLFSLMFLCFLNTNAQVGSSHWTFSNPKPFGFVSYQLAYFDDNNTLVVGDAGGIAKSTDGGGTWTYFSYTTTNDNGDLVRPTFNDVQVVNSNLAFAVGNNGVMIKTIDGGTNWTLVKTPFWTNALEINTVFFTDANTGYIGGDGDADLRTAALYKTTDGGATWQSTFELPAPVETWQYATIYKVRFTPSGVGYLGGANGAVWKYANNTWSDYSITDSTVYPNVSATDNVFYDNGMGGFDTVLTSYSDNTSGLSQQNYRAIAIADDSVVVVGTQNNGGLIRINTSNAVGSYLLINNGSSYADPYHTFNSPQIYNAICHDGNKMYVATSGGQVLTSLDKGYTWQAKDVYTPGTSEAGIAFYGIDIAPSGRVGLAGQAGIIADSLTQWRRPYVYTKKSLGFGGYGIDDLSFADADHGIVAGGRGTMLRTANSGTTWEDITTGGFSPWDYYTAIDYVSPTTLLAAASNGMFYKSSDAGTSFDLLFADANNANLTGMHFINEDTGWIAANVTYTDDSTYENSYHQIIYRTTDGGNTWDSSATVFPIVTDYALNNYLNDIKFLNGNIGYAAGNNGSMFKSTDGGVNWIQLTTPSFASDKNIISIAVVDENTVYVSGDQALVMKSTDGGANWTVINSGLPGGFARYPKVLMYDAAMGMVFTSGTVYTTINGGATWTPNYVPVNDNFYAAEFAPVNGCTTGICKKVFAGGFFRGNILKFDADVVLPVKFSNLTGSGTANGNQLFWTAFAQETVAYFEVERSTNGADFKKIGDKINAGALSYQSYQWLDITAAEGKNYYRIKAIEKSGAVYYTKIVLISTKKPAKWNYQVSNGSLVLNNVKVQRGNVTATVVNAGGQVIAAKSWNQNGGAFNQSILLPATAKGIYYVKVDNEGALYSFRILIQ